MMEISTERLVLRPPEERDLAGIAELLDDLAVSAMLARVPHPYRLDHAKAWFALVQRGDGEGPVFAISTGGDAIGMIGFRDQNGEQTLGYWLGRPHWGLGLMTEAARAAIGWFFGNNDEDEIFAGAFTDNPASLRVQRKLGFEPIGESQLECLATGQARLETKTRLSRETFLRVAAPGREKTPDDPLTQRLRRAT